MGASLYIYQNITCVLLIYVSFICQLYINKVGKNKIISVNNFEYKER